jgi:lipoprotein-anchoring transpeptidase ErfK/SrfK
VGRKAFWPGWTPPPEMLARQPDLPAHADGSLANPLGARALYLFQNNKDTLFRIHGTNDPKSIGKAVSSGCIRMLNADAIDLYQRVGKGTPVVVL